MTEKLQQARQFHQAGEIVTAGQLYREVLEHTPDNFEALYWLGVLEFQNGRHEESERLLNRAIRLQPGNASMHYSLGVVLAAAGQYNKAIESYRKSTRIKPDFAEAYNNLGVTLAALGLRDDAVDAYQQAIRCKPGYIEPLNNLGIIQYEQGKGTEAVASFRKVLSASPDFVPALQYLGNAWYEQGRLEQALECYQRVSLLTGADGPEIRLATALPMVMFSDESIQDLRDRLKKRLEELLHKDLKIGDPLSEIGYTNFLLAYHGRDDRELQTLIADLYLKACPVLSYVAPHCKEREAPSAAQRIRIGFISRFLKNHSIGKTSRGIIEHLSRQEFEVVAIFLEPPADTTSRKIAEVADKVLVLPGTLRAAHECLAREKLDILFYQDTGMDAFTYFLAFSRLAPVQCTSFGHPVTTGIPNLDYYISTDFWEPIGAQSHYSEKLALLRDVASVAYYYKPSVPETLKPRSYFGLNKGDHIYLCPQTLFKVHPDFDEAIAGILRADPDGRLVFIEGKHKYWSQLLMERFQSSMSDVVERVCFLPQQRGADFINLIAVSDVMLDTHHFCGFNTSLEGLAAGIPVVTLPGTFMRSRHTMSFYRKMNYMDCVAEDMGDYINKALKLGIDPEYRAQVSRKILEKQCCLWEEIRVVREFERVFREMTGDPQTEAGLS